MSKRFGRNQKRKLNEQIKFLQDEVLFKIRTNKTLERSNHELRSQNDYLNNVIKNVEEVLGEYFIGLPPKEKESLFNELPPEWRDCLPPKMRAFDISAKPQATMILNTVQTLARYKFESFVDHLRQQRHFFLTKKGDHFLAYCIDENHLNKLPFDELAQIIAKSFAHHIKTGK